MKYLFIIFLLVTQTVFAKNTNKAFLPEADSANHLYGAFNNSCAAAFTLCKLTIHEFDYNYQIKTPKSRSVSSGVDGGGSIRRCTITPLYYKFKCTASGSINLLLDSTNASFSLYGPFFSDDLTNCELIESYQSKEFSDSLFDGTNETVSIQVGYYILKVTPEKCRGVLTLNFNDLKTAYCSSEKLCSECVTSFSPKAGKYIVSAWVKEGNASESTVTYTNPSIKIRFNGLSTVAYTINASGKIIDGWQKMDAMIDIPISSTSIALEFFVKDGEAFFDDVRFFPTDGSMMSYVYDPTSLRLMAELDERNYATLYEYDEEGKLIRIKKETEKGIMTIQENRDNIRKN